MKNKAEYLSLASAFLVITLLPMLIYWDLYRAGEICGDGDMLQGLSAYFFSSAAVWNGEGIPLWAPWLSNGIPYLADVSLPTLYPPMLLLGFLPMLEYTYIYYGLHLAIGSIFFYLYLMELGCSKGTSICAALLYLFSIHLGGYRKTHIVIIATVVWLPMLLFSIERYVKTEKFIYFILLVLGMAVQFFGGFVQDEFYTDLFVVVYFCAVSYRGGMKWKKIACLCGGITGAYLGLIAVNLFPAIELLKEYLVTGSHKMSLETFCAGSPAPWKLFMMVFPKFFGEDIFEYGGLTAASGFDIELFLGIVVFFFIVYSFRYLDNFYIRLSLAIMAVIFGIAAHSHIPGLSNILFHIPVFNNMRLVCRVLFIFILFGYVLFALTFEEFRRRNEWNELRLLASGAFLFSICLAIICGWYYGKDDFWNTVWNRTGSNLLTFLAFILLLYFLGEKRKKYTILLILTTIISWGECFPYWRSCRPTPIEYFTADNSLYNQRQDADKYSYKCLDAFAYLDGGHESDIALNKALVKRVMAINSYMSFNNPRLYQYLSRGQSAPLNFSGLFTGFVQIDDLLHFRQNVFSMIGVKYIIDSSRRLSRDANVYQFIPDNEALLYQANINFTAEKPFHCEWFPFPQISPNTVYRVSFQCLANQTPDFFYIDLYDASVDKADPEMVHARAEFALSAQNEHWIGYISCGNYQQMKYPILRIVSNTKETLSLQDFTVTRCEKVKVGEYAYLGERNGQKIFENLSACSLFYIPSEVKLIDSFNVLYRNPEAYAIDKVSYLEKGPVTSFTPGAASIFNISVDNNRMSAQVKAETDTFINFSQNYYPGWRAYIDGEETNVFFVNGLIQGIFVPAGEHEIVFSYFPNSLKWGMGVSALTLFSLFSYAMYQRKRRLLEGDVS